MSYFVYFSRSEVLRLFLVGNGLGIVRLDISPLLGSPSDLDVGMCSTDKVSYFIIWFYNTIFLQCFIVLLGSGYIRRTRCCGSLGPSKMSIVSSKNVIPDD